MVSSASSAASAFNQRFGHLALAAVLGVAGRRKATIDVGRPARNPLSLFAGATRSARPGSKLADPWKAVHNELARCNHHVCYSRSCGEPLHMKAATRRGFAAGVDKPRWRITASAFD